MTVMTSASALLGLAAMFASIAAVASKSALKNNIWQVIQSILIGAILLILNAEYLAVSLVLLSVMNAFITLTYKPMLFSEPIVMAEKKPAKIVKIISAVSCGLMFAGIFHFGLYFSLKSKKSVAVEKAQLAHTLSNKYLLVAISMAVIVMLTVAMSSYLVRLNDRKGRE